MVDGCLSKLVNVVSGVPQESVMGPLLFLLYTSLLFYILENKQIGYADDSTLMAVVSSPGVRVTVTTNVHHCLYLSRVMWWGSGRQGKCTSRGSSSVTSAGLVSGVTFRE